MAVGEIYKGEEFIFLVEIETDDGKEIVRPFDQTGGSVSSSADEIEIATKDRTGADYGDITQTISLEGNITEGDPFVKAIKKAQREKKYADRKSTRLNSSHVAISYAVFCLKKKIT